MFADFPLERQDLGLNFFSHSLLALLHLAYDLHCFLVGLLHFLESLLFAVFLFFVAEDRLSCELEHIGLGDAGGS